MNEQQEAALADILFRALGSPIGLLVHTNDVVRGRAALYRKRKELGDPALEVLQIRISPLPEGELVIVKGAAPQASNEKGLS